MTADILNMMTVLENALQGMSIQKLPRFRGELKRLDALAELQMLTGPQHEQGEAELLTVPEVAKKLKMGSYRVYELIRHGELKAVHLGRLVRVKRSAVVDYLTQNGG